MSGPEADPSSRASIGEIEEAYYLDNAEDTLGGKYPFFFRNGNTSYKDFPISALISMLADENEFFCSWKESIERDERRTSL